MLSRKLILTAILLVSASGIHAAGTITTYTTRAAFGGDAVADWGALGGTSGPGFLIGAVFNNMVTSVPGVAVSGTSTFPVTRVDQGANYFGNFAPADRLLMTTAVAALGTVGKGPGPIHFTFSTGPVFGAGVQISTNVLGPFTATLKAFDVSGVLLATASAAGTSTSPAVGDNSAPFLGIRSTLQEIAAVEVDVPGLTGVTVNQMAIGLSAAITTVTPGTTAAGVITSYGNALAFGGDTVVDWGGLGATVGAQLVIGNFLNLASSTPGLTVSGSSTVSDLTRVDQGVNYFGNFAPGDKLLITSAVAARGVIPKAPGPMHFTFSAPVFGAGFQVSTNVLGPFTATLKAFNAAGVLLGTVSATGISTSPVVGDNSAPFLGIRSTLKEITAVEVDVPGLTGVTVNRMDIAITLPPSPFAAPTLSPTAVANPATLFTSGLTAPKGALWMGTHVWVVDRAHGFCKVDPTLLAPSLTACAVLPLGFVPGAPAFDKAANLVYLPDTSVLGAGIVRLPFDPVLETVGAPVTVATDLALTAAAGVGATTPTALALGPDGKLYAAMAGSTKIVSVGSPSTATPVVGLVGGMNAAGSVSLAFYKSDLYDVETAGVSVMRNATLCSVICTAEVLPVTLVTPASIASDGTFVYVGDPAHVWKYDPVANTFANLADTGLTNGVLTGFIGIAGIALSNVGQIYAAGQGPLWQITTAPPAIASLSPVQAPASTTQTVTITGSNFLTGVAVRACPAITVSGVSFISPTQITATLAINPLGPLGPCSVTVTTANGTSAAANFTVLAKPPALATITPASGLRGITTANNVAVTLTGTSLTGGTVSAGSIAATIISITDTQIIANFAIPATVAAGPVNVVVTTPSGASNALTFTVNAPVVVVPASAAFVKTDTTTQGSWKGIYGADGQAIANDVTNYAVYAQVTFSGQSPFTWLGTTTDVRALQNATGRIASTWFSPTSFNIDINLIDGLKHQVALYLLDWDSATRAETVDVLDAGTGLVLNSQPVAAFSAGKYLVWNLGGHVIVRITRTGGANAVVSGLFFGPAPVASAVFVKADITTQGSWRGIYGANGEAIANDVTSYPLYAQVAFSGQAPFTWLASSTDVRALQNGAATGRIASTWFSATSFSIDINLTDGLTHQVALYLLDWDSTVRAETIDVLDAASGLVLNSQPVAAFSAGRYLVWNLGGHVVVRVTRTGGANAVASGLFFGPAAPAVVTNPASAVFVKTDINTQGSWKGIYGVSGEAITNDVTNYPLFAQVALSGQSPFTWLAATTDVRALQSATGRIASAWFSPTSFSIDLNLTDGLTHQLALYLLDWDSNVRAETIDVLDAASGLVLNSQPVAAFSAGKYLVWNLGGHVILRVTWTGGANAVVSGLFFN